MLVTGASSGIGRELAVQLAPRAKALVLAARRTERLEELRASLVAGHPQPQVAVLGAGLAVMPASAAYCGSKHFIDGFSEALRADLTGTGVVVTQVCPGPVDSEFDQVAGTEGGMAEGPPQFLRITAAECARQALAGRDWTRLPIDCNAS